MASKRPKRKEVTQIKKVAHNVVESRRKQRISQSVELLSHLVSSCDCGKETRAEILQKAVDKIRELKTTNKELQDTINGQTSNDGSDESHLQTKLALTLAEHIHLMLVILKHKQKIKPSSSTTNETTATNRLLVDKPVSSERLGFGVENLLETTPAFERTQVHNFPHDTNCIPLVSITTREPQRDNADLYFSNGLDSSSSWSASSYCPSTTYYTQESTDWHHPPPPPSQQLHHHHYSQLQFPLVNSTNGSYIPVERVPGPTMWRPYNDSQSLPLSPPAPPIPLPPNTSTYSHQQQPSTSFLVGQLLENIQ